MSGIPWDQPGADPLADLDAFLRAGYETLPGGSNYQPHVPLLSPSCGLHDEHAPACRSAICECRCHWPVAL